MQYESAHGTPDFDEMRPIKAYQSRSREVYLGRPKPWAAGHIEPYARTLEAEQGLQVVSPPSSPLGPPE